MRHAKLIILTIFLLAATGCSHNEKDSISLPDDGSIIISDRLSNQQVNAFTEDSDGHIWIATSRGLDKYTSNEFHQFFCTDDTLGLPDNQINDVFKASDGRLWAATSDGMAYRKDDGHFRRIEVAGDIRSMSGIMETPDGGILASNSVSLFLFDEESDIFRPVIREYFSFGNPSGTVDDRYIWVVTFNNTLDCYDVNDFSRVSSTPLPFRVYHLCDAGNGELWMSGLGELCIFDKENASWKALPEQISARKDLIEGDIDLMFNIENRSVLMNVIGKGMFLYNRSNGTVISQGEAGFPYNIPDAEIRTVFRDSRKNLWFGTTDQGFSVSYQNKDEFNSNKFLTEAFRKKTVTSLCADKQGFLWITTLRDGLFVYDIAAKELRPLDVSHLITDNKIGYIRSSHVFCDSEGEIWLLFADKYQVVRGRYDGKSFNVIDSFPCIIPFSIEEDDQGHIWVGGLSNILLKYDKKTRSVKNVELPSSSQGFNMVMDLTMLEPGRLLAGAFDLPVISVNTYSDEVTLTQMNPEDIKACIRRNRLIPSTLFLDSAGDIWTGTSANGLMHNIRPERKMVRVEGVPCPDICSIEEDRQGNIWVSTMNGLGKYDRTVGSFVNYYDTDGIGGNQFSLHASAVLDDGTLVFGGNHGITWFNPLDIPRKRNVPLVFEYLKIHNKPVTPSEDGPIDRVLSEKPDITIRHDQNAFSITFAALDYSEYKRIRYYYKMEGFDRNWVDAGHNPEAYYANLPSGHYVFKVRIDDSSHTLVNGEASLNVTVLSPWYSTWWAIILWSLLGIAVLATMYYLYRHIRKVRAEASRRIREVHRQREKAEEARAAEKELNRIQMNYFSNVAHEFRTPLTMIAGPAQQLASSEGIKGQDRQLVDIIRRNSTWMLSLVNQLLDFNRIGNRKLQMKVAKMDIVSPLRDIADLFRFNAESKGIELSTYGLEEPFTMWVDADKVQKIVMNLMSNALKFTPSGGKVSLSFDVIPRDEAAAAFPLKEEDKDSRFAMISVSDTGPGIKESELEQIFERFYQSHDGKNVQGSGIGLYYARLLTSIHHGYIKASNKPGGGAVFSMVIPTSASSYSEDERTEEAPKLQILPAGEPVAPADLSSDGAPKKHIAVIDDDIDIANYLKIMLQPLYEVSLYFDATSALKGMEENIPDLVISDVVMPGMSGYELCERIKGDLQLSHIPVVLVTAKVAVENQVQGLGKGADAYVTKPFQPAYLMALVKSLLDNRDKIRRQLGSVTTTEEIAPEVLSPRDSAFMKELYELMEKELANVDLDITRMTEMMKISRTKFYYKVKGLTGENPSVFFKRYKLNRAADLLKEGKYNMSEIAYMTGFNTLSHFSTSFKKQFGIPPSEYTG